MHFYFWLVFTFANKTDLTLKKLKTFNLTMSNSCIATFSSSLNWPVSWAALHPGFCLLGLLHILSMSCHIICQAFPCEFLLHLQLMSISIVWFCSVECFVLLLMLFHGIKIFISFYGLHECFLCSIHFHSSVPG